jgi:hypothetical protein
MRALVGYGLLIAGTVLGSLGGARVPRADWALAGAGLVVLLVGWGLLRRRGEGAAPGDVAAGATSPGGVPESGSVAASGAAGASARKAAQARAAADVRRRVAELQGRLEELAVQGPSLSLPDLRDRLGALDRDFLRPLGDEIPGLLSALGPEAFAASFGTYAGAERALHRAWSAATDGHRPEALAALGRGRSRLREALEAM